MKKSIAVFLAGPIFAAAFAATFAVSGAFLFASVSHAEEAVQSESKPPSTSQDQSSQLSVGGVPIKLGGGAYFWNYNPFLPGVHSFFDVYAAYLTVDSELDNWGVHMETRFRNTPLRPFYGSDVWLQEVYGYRKCQYGAIKVGKIYSRFGFFWDNSFYGNVQYFDGLKLAPYEGISLEGTETWGSGFGLDHDLQFFVNDGLTNGSVVEGACTGGVNCGRDTVGALDPGTGAFAGHQRNILVVREEPFLRLSGNRVGSLGLSYQMFEADFPTAPSDEVYRYSADLTILPLPGLKVYGEFTHQEGRSAQDWPLFGVGSSNISYVLAGAEQNWGQWTFRFNASWANYEDDNVQESIYEPAIMYSFNHRFSILGEYVLWRHDENSRLTTLLDRSLNFVLFASL